MAKLHTRAKRNLSLTSGLGHKGTGSIMKKTGAKTFKTSEAAQEYAKTHKIKGEIVPAKKGKKFKIDSSE